MSILALAQRLLQGAVEYKAAIVKEEMSSDGSEVWSIESRKTDEQVEMEIIHTKPIKTKNKIPQIPQNLNFTPQLVNAMADTFKKGEIVWFHMDGSTWPCLVLQSSNERKEKTKSLLIKPKVQSGVYEIAQQHVKPIISQKNSKHKFQMWKIWPGASVFKRNLHTRKILKFTKDSDKSADVVLDSESEDDHGYNNLNLNSKIISNRVESLDSLSDVESSDASFSDFDQTKDILLDYSQEEKFSKKFSKDNLQKRKRSYSSSDNSISNYEIAKPEAHSSNLVYDLVPLPLSLSLLHEIWKKEESNYSDELNSMKVERVSRSFIKPWLHKDLFPIPSDDETKNLSILQAVHTSCSWAIPDSILKILTEKEQRHFRNSSNSSILYIPIEYYRHGTEIISVGDFVRIITNLRQTRNVISNQTTQILYIASLTVVSQLSFYQDSMDSYWDHDVLLFGLVYEPRGTSCISTGEYRTVNTDGICGRWYSSLSNINRKMPAIEESSWIIS